MQTREDFKEIVEQFRFERDTLHTCDIKDKDVERVKNCIAATDLKKHPKATLTIASLCKYVGMYYLYQKKEIALAIQYFKKFQHLVNTDPYLLAEACVLLNSAKLLDASYQNVEELEVIYKMLKSLIEPSLTNELRDEEDITQLTLYFALAGTNLAEAHHRQGADDKACEYLNEAIGIQNRLAEKEKTAELDLIFSYLALFRINIEKQNPLANTYLEKAINCYENFYLKTQIIHPVKFTLQLAQAQYFASFNNNSNALKVLIKLHQEQCDFYKNAATPEIQETLQARGNLHAKLEEYQEAYEVFQTIVTNKKTYLPANSLSLQKSLADCEFIQMKMDALKRQTKIYQLTAYPHYDWNDAATLVEYEKQFAKLFAEVKDLIKGYSEKLETPLAKRCSELGSYFLYRKQQLKQAIYFLELSKKNLQAEDLTWTLLHLMLGYFQKSLHVNTNPNPYLIKAEELCDSVINEYAYKQPQENNILKILSFAHYGKGNVNYEHHYYSPAIEHYQRAFDMYNTLNADDLQFAFIKMGLACALNHQTNPVIDPFTLFEEVNLFWQTQPQCEKNLFAASFHVIYANALMHEEKELALKHYEKAYDIYLHVEGIGSITVNRLLERIQQIKYKIYKEKNKYTVSVANALSSFWHHDAGKVLTLTAIGGLAAVAVSYSMKKNNRS